MTRRPRGDGGLHWDDSRQRWIASATVGYDGRGQRVVRRGSGRTKTEAKAKLRVMLRDQHDGLLIAQDGYTVRHAVEDWLEFGLSNRQEATRAACGFLCRTHVAAPSRGAEAAGPDCPGG